VALLVPLLEAKSQILLGLERYKLPDKAPAAVLYVAGAQARVPSILPL